MKILIAEDSRLTRRMIEKYLIELGFEVLCAEDGQEAWDIYSSQDVRMIITDWEMPNMNGLQLVQKIRESSEEGYCYIIILTAKEDKKDLVEGLKNGADDFIRKPFDKDELAVRVRVGERIVKLQQKLELQADTDPLTNLTNRRGMMRNIQNMNTSELESMSFIMADIDHFKKVNDDYGHDAGDIILKGVSNRIKGVFRTYDEVSRVGGEEFFIVAKGADEKVAKLVTERARRAIEVHPFSLPDSDTQISVTCSFGVLSTKVTDDFDLDKYMKLADEALYFSKENGRNQVTIKTL